MKVLHKAARRNLPANVVEDQRERLRITIRPFDIAQAGVTAELHSRDISFADRACLALGMVTNRPVITTERAWPLLGLDIDIRLIR